MDLKRDNAEKNEIAWWGMGKCSDGVSVAAAAAAASSMVAMAGVTARRDWMRKIAQKVHFVVSHGIFLVFCCL